jgi:N-acetylmuramoyl-L-alanine amidase
MVKRVYIDPGHSNVDPGAVGYAVERDLNEKTAKYMDEYLQTTYVCETKVDPITNNSVKQIADNANAWGADLLVSIHNNAGGGDGYEALVYSSKNKPLGQMFEKHVKAIGQNSRGVKYRPDLGVLRLSHMPAVLNEGAFVDNKKDIQDWNDDHELKRLGIAYAKAAAEFLELPMKSAPTPAPNPETVPTPTPADGMYRVFGADGKQKGAYREEANAINELKKQLHAGGSAKITLSEK